MRSTQPDGALSGGQVLRERRLQFLLPVKCRAAAFDESVRKLLARVLPSADPDPSGAFAANEQRIGQS
jgi:hypothetical protein